MNYLAHAYLSFQHPDVLAGNMISDFVKGKKQYDYPVGIFRGIRLHRAIDAYTDAHPSTRVIRDLFRPLYRLYAGAFADVVYDFFLANDRNEFPDDRSLKEFTDTTYRQLEDRFHWLPDSFQLMFLRMKEQNWLYHYQFDWGIQKSFNGVVRRAAYLDESDRAYDLFLANQELLKKCYDHFFPQLKEHAMQTMEQLLNSD